MTVSFRVCAALLALSILGTSCALSPGTDLPSLGRGSGNDIGDGDSPGGPGDGGGLPGFGTGGSSGGPVDPCGNAEILGLAGFGGALGDVDSHATQFGFGGCPDNDEVHR